MKKCVWKILIICLCCMVQGVEAQTGKVYTTDMGLSSSLINQIFQLSLIHISEPTRH